MSSMKNNLAQNFNVQILKIWDNHFEQSTNVLAPLLYGDFNTNCILFIGLNPSFSLNGFKKITRGTEFEGIDVKSYFSFANVRKHMNEIIKIEQLARQKYPYFNQIKAISAFLDLPWEHLDLCQERLTNQSKFVRKYLKRGELSPLANDQFKLAWNTISVLKPCIIVVINARASQIIRDKSKKELQYHQSQGFHTIELGDRTVPIFFSGMLSGQRALDIGSYERLKWHMHLAKKSDLYPCHPRD